MLRHQGGLVARVFCYVLPCHILRLLCIAYVLCGNFRFKHFVERLEEKIRINDTSSDDDSEY